MSRSTPIAPITLPSESRSAAALRLVGITSPEALQRLLDDLVLAEAEQLGDRVVGLEDLPLQVGDEHRVGRVRDDDVGDESAARGGSILLRLTVGVGFRRGGTQDFFGHWLPPGRVGRSGCLFIVIEGSPGSNPSPFRGSSLGAGRKG